MKITKPSQLREGMKLRGKYMGLPISGHASKADSGTWHILPQYVFVANPNADYIDPLFTDLESVEGIRAAKEGDLLVDKRGDECEVLMCTERIVVISHFNDFHCAGNVYTYQQLEENGYKLKDQEQQSVDTITLDGKTYKRDDVLERIKELEPID